MDASRTPRWPRRTFLAAAAGTAAVAVLPSGPAAALARASTPSALRRAGWTDLVGRRATVDDTPMVVVEVSDLPGAPPGHDTRFAVLLRAPDRGPVPSGLCTVARPDAGRTQLHVSPVDRGARRRWAQIVINNPS